MKMCENAGFIHIKKTAVVLLCLCLSALFSVCTAAEEKDDKEVIRVGWYESSFNHADAAGNRSGYGYEYQMKIAAYTGWKYEYVTGSWVELLQMLEDGTIDLLSDVSFTEERAEKMLFSSLPMGTEEYYLFTSWHNREISASDYSSLNGKRVGVNKGSLQADLYREWARRNGVKAEVVEVTGAEEESLHMLEDGGLDAYVTVDFFINPEGAVPVYKIGSSDFYFAVSKKRPELVQELDAALSKIQDENRYYHEQLFEQHIKRAGANVFFTPEEVEWLSAHKTIRVGYQDDYMAFCEQDPKTGELTGILKDYLDYASDCMVNTHIEFEAVAYPSVSAALEAMHNKEVDCVFPANICVYDGEELGVVMTPPLMDTEIYAVVSTKKQKSFSQKEHVIVAVNEGNPNYDAFLDEHFSDWRKVYFPTTEDCLKAISEGMADCVLISDYRYNNLERTFKKYHLSTLTTGLEMDYYFAVDMGNADLYSIMTKIVGMVPGSTVTSALTRYITQDAKLSFADFLSDHLAIVLTVAGLIMLIILVLLVLTMRAAGKARRLIAATETDDLTGLYNRDFFFQYAYRIYHERPDASRDAIVVNIDQFHSVNALNGRDFGDRVLRVLGDEIQTIAQENGGIAGRFGADRFDIYCRHLPDPHKALDRLQNKISHMAPNTNIRLRMGVMTSKPDLDPIQLFDSARTACSMARGNYKNLIIFDEQVREREIYEQRLLNDLPRALDSYEFEVYYQPQFDIQCDPPRLVSAEALVRWNHPELGMIPPADFILLFEKNGQISAVDQFVWSEAARQAARWRREYGAVLPISVNLSRADVFDPALEKILDEILAYNQLDHHMLKLEVTETAYTENADQLIQVVENLRAKGYEVEMDDFGTGYSSLNMLSAMPVDILKMDREFIRNIAENEKDIQLVALILDIAGNLKIPVVAEGVETEEQMRLLKELGCPLVQGYYFSRPLHPSEFEASYFQQKHSAG